MSFAIAAVGATIYLFMFTNLSLVPVFIVCSRIGTMMAFNVVYASNNQFFPTRYLATTFGIVNFISHLISVGAPILAEVPHPLPFLVFLANTVIGMVASVFL